MIGWNLSFVTTTSCSKASNKSTVKCSFYSYLWLFQNSVMSFLFSFITFTAVISWFVAGASVHYFTVLEKLPILDSFGRILQVWSLWNSWEKEAHPTSIIFLVNVAHIGNIIFYCMIHGYLLSVQFYLLVAFTFLVEDTCISLTENVII